MAPSPLDLRVDEPPDPTDPDTAQAGLTPGFVAYSASGRVEGEVVYANYGLPADYEALEARGVSARRHRPGALRPGTPGREGGRGPGPGRPRHPYI